jgi:hypothetical protein
MKVKANNRIEMTPCVDPIGSKMHLLCKKKCAQFQFMSLLVSKDRKFAIAPAFRMDNIDLNLTILSVLYVNPFPLSPLPFTHVNICRVSKFLTRVFSVPSTAGTGCSLHVVVLVMVMMVALCS